MGKLLILSITDGEEQLLDKLKDFLAEAPGIEIVEPPATKHTLTFPGLELHLRKQTVKWRGRGQHHQPAPPEDGAGQPHPHGTPQRL